MRIKESTVAKFTARKRVGMFDETQRVMCDWSLGFFVGAMVPHVSIRYRHRHLF